MSDEQNPTTPVTPQSRLTAQEIANKSFSHARKGLDEGEVRDFLALVAVEYEAATTAAATTSAVTAAVVTAPPAVGELTVEQVEAALGGEIASVLRMAREAAEKIRTSGDAEAKEVKEHSIAESVKIREEADSYNKSRTEAADLRAEQIETDAAHRASDIRAEAQKVLDDAEATIEAAKVAELEACREEGQKMVAEAREVRGRILAELDRRQSLGEARLAELDAGRANLIAAYSVVQRTLGEATNALGTSAPAVETPDVETEPAVEAFGASELPGDGDNGDGDDGGETSSWRDPD